MCYAAIQSASAIKCSRLLVWRYGYEFTKTGTKSELECFQHAAAVLLLQLADVAC